MRYEKSCMFILGCPNLLLVTDHKPLVKILGDCSLEKIHNPRLFRLKERTLPYTFTIKHVPGNMHHGPDACSRRPSISTLAFLGTESAEEYSHDALTLSIFCEAAITSSLNAMHDPDDIHTSAITLERVREASLADNEITALAKAVMSGFPDEDELLDTIKSFWKYKDDITCMDGICLYDVRVIIPAALRKEVLDCLHSAHQGVAGMRARAARSVFWPGINAAISSRRAQCRYCNTIAPSQAHEPMTPSPTPCYPFQRVVADYFYMHGHQYLAYADRYTGWITIARCDPLQANSKALCRELRTLFGIYGAPEELSSDGGQPFPSRQFQEFLTLWGVEPLLVILESSMIDVCGIYVHWKLWEKT